MSPLFASRFQASRLLNQMTSQLSLLPHRVQCRALITTMKFPYRCGVESEDPNLYRSGSYYPVKLNDELNHGRYKILHKLGWGGFATIWLAKDNRQQRNVALKIIKNSVDNERQIMKHLAAQPFVKADSENTDLRRVVTLLDDFDIDASYSCLVMNISGSSVRQRAESYDSGHIPGRIAKDIARQVFQGIRFLHKSGVGHGDLHTNNVLFISPKLDNMAGDQLLQRLGPPRIGSVTREDGEKIEDNMPPYLVSPIGVWGSDTEVQIIDFGSAFFFDVTPSYLRAPISTQAPEAILGQPITEACDIWSAGCMLFEIITGRSFIETLFASRATVIAECISLLGPPPHAWYAQMDTDFQRSVEKHRQGLPAMTINDYLRLVYFDELGEFVLTEEEKAAGLLAERTETLKPDFSEDSLQKLSALLGKILRWQPEERLSAEEVLQDPFFTDADQWLNLSEATSATTS